MLDRFLDSVQSINLPSSLLSEDSRKRAMSLPLIVSISPHPTLTPSASFTTATPISKSKRRDDNETTPESSPPLPQKHESTC